MSESNRNGSFDRNLEKVFRTHEHRIEDELHKMSQSFEKCAQSQDIALMSNFFEYLNYRLVATCKKIEVDYFSKKAEQSNNSVVTKPIDKIADKKKVEILDMFESDDSMKNELIDQKLKDEDQMHGDWENEQLKIVEDYDSNGVPDAETSNEQIESLDTSCDTSSKVEYISDSETVHNKSTSSSNLSMDFMYGLEMNSKASEKGNILAKKRPILTDASNEQAKKPKTIVDMETGDELEDGEILESTGWKNTNKNIYAVNTSYRFKCMLCDDLATNLIEHLKANHPESEVYVARPSPTMAEKIRRRTETFTCAPSLDEILGICFFCEQSRRMSLSDWKDHLLYHTGETVAAHVSAMSNDHKAELMAFMCKACNYTQMDENRLKKHRLNEHGESRDVADSGYDRVVLIPDLTPLKPIQTKNIEFIDEATRFKCGIGWCEYKSSNYSSFKSHLRQNHESTGKDESFGCSYCSEIIDSKGKSFVRDVTEHLKLHGKYLFWCIFCKQPFSSEINIILHIIHEHPMKTIRFRHESRESWSKSPAIEEFFAMLRCNKCSGTFNNFVDASNHFRMSHGSLNIDYTVNKLIKNTAVNLATSLGLNKYPLTLRQFFECSLCDETRFNESSLIKHFTKSHRKRSLILKPGEVFIKYVDKTENDDIVLNDIRSVFYCYVCYENGGQFVGYANSQDVFGHWFSTHSEPFRFAKAQIAKCLHCDLMGTYQGLNWHHIQAHPNETFAMVDVIIPDKCGLCQHIGQKLDEHFEHQHKSIEVFCPIPLSNASLKEVIDMKGQKKRRCEHCNEVFETKNEFKMHHEVKHPLFKAKSYKFYDNKTVHMITGCCRKRINPDELFGHLIDHKFPTRCSECSFATSDLIELKTHTFSHHDSEINIELMYFQMLEPFFWKTKVIFGNGLVLNKHNLVGTDRDDSQQFKEFVEINLRDELFEL